METGPPAPAAGASWGSWLRAWTVGTWQELHLAALCGGASPAAEPAAPTAAPAFSLRPLVILLTAAASLTLLNSLGVRLTVVDLVPQLRHHPEVQLLNLAYWAAWCGIAYVLLPALVVAVLPGEKLRDYGLGLGGFGRHLRIYLGLFALVFPLVFIASYGESFKQMYPFYAHANQSWRMLELWELLYGFQFFALEFFFRGFLLFGLRRHLGAYAIFVMVVPYCMIHFTKPMPEIFGSIGAGLILGTLALRTGSIWGGVIVHILVARSMDYLALWQNGQLPDRF